MKKFDVGKSFQNKKTKYGGYSALLTAVFLAIILVINLIAGRLDLKVDMTKNKLYSLSEATYSILEKLDKDVKIYGFYEAGQEDPTIGTLIEKYGSGSKRVSVEYKDPIKYPQFAKQFAGESDSLSPGSLVVQSGDKFRVIGAYDMFNFSYDNYGQAVVDSMVVEQKVTSAIVYVTSDETSVVYALSGHGEASIPLEVSERLEDQNYTVKDMNLLLKEAELNRESTLMVLAPARDLSSEEASMIKGFLADGGRAVFMMNFMENDMPNFKSLLNGYGVDIKRTVIVEGNPSRSARNPIYLFPEMKSHEILNPLRAADLPVMIPGAQAIETLSVKKASTTIEPLLVTSNNSWGKSNLESTTAEKELGDFQGPFDIAAAIIDKTADRDTKLVVVANSMFVNPDFAGTSGNADFVVNSFNWLQDKKDSISISPKSLDVEALNINALQQLVLSGVVVILIPLIIIILGVRIWLRRRHQ